jgi:CheY-like chemotaxis protein
VASASFAAAVEAVPLSPAAVESPGAAAVEASPAAHAPAVAAATASSFLIVDDDLMNRVIMEAKLKSFMPQLRVATAATGEKALECIRQEVQASGGTTLPRACPYDVIVLDQHMQGGGGVLKGSDVCALITSMGFEPKPLLIACSGNCMEEDVKVRGSR